MELEDFLFDLEEELGEIISLEERSPGVYHIGVDQGELFLQEYFAVLDTAPVAAKVRNYGKKMDGLRLFAQADDSSGWRIVQYEVSKYNIAVQRKPVPEAAFRDASLQDRKSVV